MTDAVARLWRLVWTPKAVRDLEDAGPEQVAHTLPDAPPPVEAPGLGAVRRRLDEVEERNTQIEARMRELARYYDRAENGSR